MIRKPMLSKPPATREISLPLHWIKNKNLRCTTPRSWPSLLRIPVKRWSQICGRRALTTARSWRSTRCLPIFVMPTERCSVWVAPRREISLDCLETIQMIRMIGHTDNKIDNVFVLISLRTDSTFDFSVCSGRRSPIDDDCSETFRHRRYSHFVPA